MLATRVPSGLSDRLAVPLTGLASGPAHGLFGRPPGGSWSGSALLCGESDVSGALCPLRTALHGDSPARCLEPRKDSGVVIPTWAGTGGLAQVPFLHEALAHRSGLRSEPGEPDTSRQWPPRRALWERAKMDRMRQFLEGPESQARETSSVTE